MERALKLIMGMSEDNGPLPTGHLDEVFMTECIVPLVDELNGTPHHARVADAIAKCVMSEHFDVKTVQFLSGLAAEMPLVAEIMDVMISLHDIREYLKAMVPIDPQLPAIYAGETLMRNLINKGKSTKAMAGWFVNIADVKPLPKPSAVVTSKTVLAPFNILSRVIAPVGLCSDAGPSRFKRLTWGLLDGVLGPNLVAAGGSVLASLTDSPFSDVDLFFVGIKDRNDATTIMLAAIKKIIDNSSNMEFKLHVMSGVMTLTARYSDDYQTLKVQFVQRLYKELAQIPLSFDLPPTRFVFDGSHIYGMKSGLYSVVNGITLPDPMMATSPARAYKYDQKGFTYTVPLYTGIKDALVDVYMSLDKWDIVHMIRKNDLVASVAFGRYITTHPSARPEAKTGVLPSTFSSDNHTPRLLYKELVKKNDIMSLFECPRFRHIIGLQWHLEDPTVRMYAGDSRTFLSL